MCGRFGLYIDLAGLVATLGFELPMPMEVYRPRWDIAASTDVLTIIDAGGVGEGVMMRWGLIPSWVKPESVFGRPMFNARSETVAERPMFRNSFRRRHCLISANGFFEWRREETGGKTPMWIFDAEKPVLVFAAIWSVWDGPKSVVESCAILTTSANSLMSPIHDRMPVIPDREWAEVWLDDASDRSVLMEAVKPREWKSMQAREVDPAVGSTRSDGPHLINPRPSFLL